MESGVHPIIGSSGLSQKDTKTLVEFCAEKKLGGLIIPNFSIAFAFINKISKELSQYYEDISIVEYHKKKISLLVQQDTPQKLWILMKIKLLQCVPVVF